MHRLISRKIIFQESYFLRIKENDIRKVKGSERENERMDVTFVYLAKNSSNQLIYNYNSRQASFIKQLLAEQQRHVSCVEAGRN